MVLSSMPCFILRRFQGGRHSCSSKASDLFNRWSQLHQILIKMPICSQALHKDTMFRIDDINRLC